MTTKLMNQEKNLSNFINIITTNKQGVILIADIVNYFAFSSKLSLESLIEFVKKYYTLITYEITKQHGKVINYINDSVMAVFNKEFCFGKDEEWCATLSAFHILKAIKKEFANLEIVISLNKGDYAEFIVNQNENEKARCIIGQTVNKTARIVVSSKTSSIYATKTIIEVLGPRVTYEKCLIKYPNTEYEDHIYKLVSLNL